MGKESTGRSYEDYEVGQRVPCAAPRPLTAYDRQQWVGLVGDVIPRFADAGDKVHPLVVFAVVQGMVGNATMNEGMLELGLTNLAVHRPSEVGAVISATCRVVGAKEDASKETGVVWVRVAARDARGVVLSYVHWFRVPKRHRQSAKPVDTVPNLGEATAPKDLHTKTLGDLPQTDETGGRFAYEDYQAGETLYHNGGTLLDSSEIRHFARAFRLLRPIHHLPGLEGHSAPSSQVMGIAYALAHDGLQNRIGVSAILNVRTPHRAAPGSVLRSFTQVVNTEPISPRIGALRLRTFLFKDRMPISDDPPLIAHNQRYYEHILLDMDYWELVPTAAALGMPARG